MTRARSRDAGLRLVILYKAVKAAAELVAAAVLAGLVLGGELGAVRELGVALREDVASRWSLWAGRALGRIASDRGVRLVELGLLVDGLWSAFEGFCLWRGYAWGAWLVVVATAAPLPLEGVEILRSYRPWRVAVAALNVAVVVLLARRLRARRVG